MTGTTSNAITGVDFQPDWVWIKQKKLGTTHLGYYDVVRGATKDLSSSETRCRRLPIRLVNSKSFDSDGFTVGWYNNGARE